MLKLSRRKNRQYEQLYDYEIKDNNKRFVISYEGTLDLYFSAFLEGDYQSQKIEFEITKENYYLYQVFDTLYSNCLNCNIYKVDELRYELCETNEERKELVNEIKGLNDNLRQYSEYNMLFENEYLSWKSDDNLYEEADTLNIYKEAERYKLEFIRKNKEMHLGIVCRIRNHGSRYKPFNMPFMDLYNTLQKYDPEYHQVHVEEYLYQKRLEKIKK